MALPAEARERLIEAVRARPALYDARHPLHRDADARDRCWADISAALAADSTVLKREWKILRDSLRQAVRAVRGGAKRRWRYQARMAFLLPHMMRRAKPEISCNSMKMEVEPDEGAWNGGEAGAGAEAGAGDGGAAALELFFASVCASARALPPAPRRALQRDVLAALHRAEAAAAAPSPPPPPPPPPADDAF